MFVASVEIINSTIRKKENFATPSTELPPSVFKV
jgi:hypothetical protein